MYHSDCKDEMVYHGDYNDDRFYYDDCNCDRIYYEAWNGDRIYYDDCTMIGATTIIGTVIGSTMMTATVIRIYYDDCNGDRIYYDDLTMIGATMIIGTVIESTLMTAPNFTKILSNINLLISILMKYGILDHVAFWLFIFFRIKHDMAFKTKAFIDYVLFRPLFQ